jgi:hypothetical protein
MASCGKEHMSREAEGSGGDYAACTCSSLSNWLFMHLMAVIFPFLTHWALRTSENVPSPFFAIKRYSVSEGYTSVPRSEDRPIGKFLIPGLRAIPLHINGTSSAHCPSVSPPSILSKKCA